MKLRRRRISRCRHSQLRNRSHHDDSEGLYQELMILHTISPIEFGEAL
jgi:hypothetical protein